MSDHNCEVHPKQEKFKDLITISAADGEHYYTVYVTVCELCGSVIDDGTWVEE